MTGLHGHRVYLDWNATAPLRPEARAAMLEAMDMVGNPSSVHAEGRAAKSIIEKARGQVATLASCPPDDVVFTSGATEAAATILQSAVRGHLARKRSKRSSVLKLAERPRGGSVTIRTVYFENCSKPSSGG